jgi:hypothetical protein
VGHFHSQVFRHAVGLFFLRLLLSSADFGGTYCKLAAQAGNSYGIAMVIKLLRSAAADGGSPLIGFSLLENSLLPVVP